MGAEITRQIVLDDRGERLAEARAFVRDLLSGSPFGERDRRLITLAIDEAMVSFVRYAGAHARRGPVKLELSADLDGERLTVELRDAETDFYLGDLGAAELRTVSKAHEDHRLGLWLILHIMDEVTYVYRRGVQNALRLVRFTP